MKHPRPWKWQCATDERWGVEAEALRDVNEHLVIRLDDDFQGHAECGSHLIMEMDKDDADFIIRACNHHDELVGGIRRFLAVYESDDALAELSAGNNLRALLAKLEKSP